MRANSSTSQVDDSYRTVDEHRIVDLLCIAGWAREYRTAPEAARDAAARALERWIAAGLSFRKHEAGTRAFDPAEVVNFAKERGIAGEDDFWEHAYVATGRFLVEDLRSRLSGSQQGFSLRLERHVNLAHCEAGARVRLHLPLPLEDSACEDASMHDVHVIPDVDGETRIETGRMIATIVVPESKTASVAAEISWCHPERSERSERSRRAAQMPDIELYLRPREGLIEITSRVADLAKQLGVNGRDPIAAMRRIWDYAFEHLTLGVVHYDALGERPLDVVIESGLFDCRLGSGLIVALCRAAGIPARMRSGYALYAVPFYHYWSEVWTDDRGWLPFDLTAWDLSLRGRDAAWRDIFFGKLDERMTTETLPHIFTGFPSVRFPGAWHALARPIESGSAFGLFAVETGALVYEDRVSFRTNAAPLLP
ncbi:MAG TPA: transglutaminase-like domain-containing protein [Candidatus Acidoferrales bacterium]|nr:transglutaminase-like domain-containing protein [Candidatus Acidoferrales bacterium]